MSNTKLLQRLRAFNNSVTTATSESLYWKLLSKLCAAHGAYEFVSEINENIGNWDECMRIADLLSSQKYDDYKTHFVANQFSLLIRKHPSAVLRGVSPQDNALAKFYSAEHRCKWVNRKFRLYQTRRSPIEKQLGLMRDFVQYVLGPVPTDAAIAGEAGFGPGASIGVKEATNFARKLLAPSWSCSPSAFDLGYNVVMHHAQISSLLFPSATSYSVPFTPACYFYDSEGNDVTPAEPAMETVDELTAGAEYLSFDPVSARLAYIDRVAVTRHNKIVFVPKTAKVLRTIAVEPLLNGYIQKGIDQIMRQRMKRVGFDLSTQLINQQYAKFGSEDWVKEDGFCTLDLESASDSVSIELVRAVLPPDWFDLLNRARSKTGIVGKETLTYQKFCSMGNGFCFPLETLIFAAICHAAGAGRPRLDYVVFGDDIIVRKNHVPEVIKLLKDCGFRLNRDKTHVNGPFRESCGEDFFGGKAVRPFTLDFAFTGLVEIIKFLNLVQRNHLTRWFFGDIDYTFFNVPPDLRFVRPTNGNADAAVTVELDCFMASPFAKWNTALHCWGWMELATKPSKDSWYRRHEKGHLALVYAMLAGASSHTPFAFRRKTDTKVRRMAYSSCAVSVQDALLAA